MSNKRKLRRPPSITVGQAANILSTRSGLFMLHYAHNDGCPAARTQNAALCTCGDDVEVRLVAPFGSQMRRPRP